MTVESKSKHHHSGTRHHSKYYFPSPFEDVTGLEKYLRKLKHHGFAPCRDPLSLLLKESSAHHHSFHFFHKSWFRKPLFGFLQQQLHLNLIRLFPGKNLCQICECCNLIIPDIMLIFQWLLLFATLLLSVFYQIQLSRYTRSVLHG